MDGLDQLGNKDSWKETWGDSYLTTGEAWDDGNIANGDGWSNKWTVENGFSWSFNVGYRKSEWSSGAACKNGKRDIGESWDDGGGLGCLDWTKVTNGWTCTGGSSTTQDTCKTNWGDKIIVGTEQWDDGNKNNLDGWSSSWMIESGWYKKLIKKINLTIQFFFKFISKY